MYYTSVSYNQEFIFIENKTHTLDLDNILVEYEDWKDTSSWSTSESKEKYIQKEVKKQKNTLKLCKHSLFISVVTIVYL